MNKILNEAVKKDKLLFNELYEKTKNCNRNQLVKLLMTNERNNKEQKQRFDEAIKAINILQEIIYQQPSNNAEKDLWILDRLETIKYILKEK